MTFMELYAGIQEHFTTYYVYWIVGAVIALPFILLTRKYSVPFILYSIEITIYLCGMHLVINVIIRLVRWFAINSSMKALRDDGTSPDDPGWTAPLIEFWDHTAYNPGWIIWIELALAVIIIGLVIRYRPMKVQKKRKWTYKEKQKPPYPGARPGTYGTGAQQRPAAVKKRPKSGFGKKRR
jgi:hypothetical protein